MKQEEQTTRTYAELLGQNPCEGCPAPCCRMQISPCIPPANLMAIDHIRYTLLFPNTELTISRTGEFSYVRWVTCALFDDKKCTCEIHNTPKKPLTCVHFNPHNCWYKRNFTTEKSTDLCRFDSERFEKWIEKVAFDNNDNVIEAPSFEETLALAQSTAPLPVFHVDAALTKEQYKKD